MTYSVEVDEGLCIGSGQCELFCPSVFKVTDGMAHVVDRKPAAELRDAVFDAADACPVQAILIHDGVPDDAGDPAR